MDDRKIDEQDAEGVGEEDMASFERGEAFSPSPSSDTAHGFVPPEPEEDFDADFEDGAVYPSEAPGAPGGALSAVFSLPVLAAGAFGVLLTVLIVIFFFSPGGNQVGEEQNLAQIKQRLTYLESQLADIQQNLASRESATDVASGLSRAGERIADLERMLAVKTGDLNRTVEQLGAAVDELKSRTDSGKPVETPTAPEVQGPGDDVTYHTVKAGENLYRIALQYGLKQEELMALNGLKKDAVIHPGDQLRVSP